MPNHSPSSSGSRVTVAEFLADREGLAGEPRERFRRLLRQYGGFKEVSHRGRLWLPVGTAVVFAVTGLAIDRRNTASDGWAWIEYAFLSVALIWRLGADESKRRRVRRETDWQAYRLFLRPVILSDHPGLLDRNAPSCASTAGQVPLTPAGTFRGLIHERGPDFWWSTLVGLWVGTAILVVVHSGATRHGALWSMTFPVGGLMLGFGAWLLWRQWAYAMVKSDSRLADS